MAYSGTLVTYGQVTGVVAATGAATETGPISHLLSEVHELQTPLLRQMAVFGRWLTVVILGVAGATFAFGLLARDFTTVEMLLASVGLAVAAIPEGLPAILTITLAIGVQRMAGRRAIVRQLPAVETLGSVTVICSDKTGTLTRNEMTVQRVISADGLFGVSGTGTCLRTRRATPSRQRSSGARWTTCASTSMPTWETTTWSTTGSRASADRCTPFLITY